MDAAPCELLTLPENVLVNILEMLNDKYSICAAAKTSKELFRLTGLTSEVSLD